MRKCRIGTAKFFTLLLLLYHTSVNAHRAKHVLERYGATEKPVEQRLKEMDNRRRNYYRFHTDRDWGVCNNYHLALDSGLLGEEKCVELILDAADFKCR